MVWFSSVGQNLMAYLPNWVHLIEEQDNLVSTGRNSYSKLSECLPSETVIRPQSLSLFKSEQRFLELTAFFFFNLFWNWQLWSNPGHTIALVYEIQSWLHSLWLCLVMLLLMRQVCECNMQPSLGMGLLHGSGFNLEYSVTSPSDHCKHRCPRKTGAQTGHHNN